MYQQILLAVALQHWEEFTSPALAAREVAVALAKGSGARLAVLSVYDYGDYGEIKEPGLSAELAARYRKYRMYRIDASMETQMKTFLAGAQEMDIAITPMVQAGEPRRTIIDVAERLSADLLVISAHNKRSVLDVMLGGMAGYVSATPPVPCSW
jgi:nucleotide-binding universal stress UspA family protein